jgi:hypothetical protein
MKSQVFWPLMLCRWVNISRRFVRSWSLHLHDLPKRRGLFTRHDVISQETWLFSSTAIRASNLAQYRHNDSKFGLKKLRRGRVSIKKKLNIIYTWIDPSSHTVFLMVYVSWNITNIHHQKNSVRRRIYPSIYFAHAHGEWRELKKLKWAFFIHEFTK